MLYFDLININQDIYYAIRDGLRKAIVRGDGHKRMAIWIAANYGETYEQFADELIADVRDLVEYETAHGLP